MCSHINLIELIPYSHTGLSFPDNSWTETLLKGIAAQTPVPTMPKRLAITPDLLRVLKMRLIQSHWQMEKKRLFWMLASWAFTGQVSLLLLKFLFVTLDPFLCIYNYT